MTLADGWDLLSRRDQLADREVRPREVVALRPGEVRLAVERLAITNSTACYARLVDSPMRFTEVFAAPDGFSIAPAWGFARVAESRHPDVTVGSRYFGFLPMSTDHVITPDLVDGGLFDTTAARDFLHPWYRRYEAAEPGPLDDHRALLHPLFPASFNLAELVARQVAEGVTDVVISSASSKVAVGLARLLAERGQVRITGVTGHESFVTRLGSFHTVLGYQELDGLPTGQRTMFIDLTNSVEFMQEVYQRLGTRLAATVLVGFTHPRRESAPPALTDPVPQHFFAPAFEDEQIRSEGAEAYHRRYADAEATFIAEAPDWLRIGHGHGPAALDDALSAALAGKQPPDVGDVLTVAIGSGTTATDERN
jgi:hypothetical protein